MYDSIFSPSFGNRPRTLIGRDQIIRDFSDSLESLPGSRERTSLILGQRGSGKTVLLLEMADVARKMGYITASPTIAAKGMLERILEKIEEDGAPLLKKPKSRITGASVGILGMTAGIETLPAEVTSRSFASRLIEMCRTINKSGAGILILIDEVRANQEDLKQLIIAYQEAIGEGLDIAMVLAGLPGAISSTLNDHVLTFLNRAGKIPLPSLLFRDIDRYYRKAFAELQIDLSDEMRTMAAQAAEGSPYMMQLVGHHITKLASDSGSISKNDYAEALAYAKEDFENDICLTVLNSLSDMDRVFLTAMSEDANNSKMADITSRMGVSSAYSQLYKRRLIEAGVIKQIKRGEVSMAVPYLKSYLGKIYEASQKISR